MGQVGREPVVADDQLLQALGLGHGERVLRPAPGASQVDVLAVGPAVILGPRLEMGVGKDAEVLQYTQGPIDGGGVHARDPLLNPPSDGRRADVAFGSHDLGHDGPALGSHPQAPGSEQLENRIGRRGGHPASVSLCLAGAGPCRCDDRRTPEASGPSPRGRPRPKAASSFGASPVLPSSGIARSGRPREPGKGSSGPRCSSARRAPPRPSRDEFHSG